MTDNPMKEFLDMTTRMHGSQYPEHLVQLYEQAQSYVRSYRSLSAEEQAQNLLSNNLEYQSYEHWCKIIQDLERSNIFK